MNNLKFLSLIGYAPTILKPAVNNNYVVRSLNPVTYFPRPAGNGVTLSTFLPNEPFPANLSQVRKPLSSFYPFYNTFLPKLIPALFLLTPQVGLELLPLFTFFPRRGIPSLRSPALLFTLYPRPHNSSGVKSKKKCRETESVSPFALPLRYARVKRYSKKVFSAVTPFYPNEVKGEGGKGQSPFYPLYPSFIPFYPEGGGDLAKEKGKQRGLVKRCLVKGAGVRSGISRLVKVSKLRLTGPLHALKAFTRSLQKRISYLTLMVQFNCLLFLIKKIVKKHIANQCVNVLIKKLNLLLLTFFKYIGSLYVDFWPFVTLRSLRSSNPFALRVKRVSPSLRYPALLFTLYPRPHNSSNPSGVSKNRGFRGLGKKGKDKLEVKTERGLAHCSSLWDKHRVKKDLGEGVRAFTPFPLHLVSLHFFLLFTCPSGKKGKAPSLEVGVKRVKRGLEGRYKFGYKGYKQRVRQAKRAYISLFFCSIKGFKKMILEFSRYLKLYLYKILWKWVQKRDTKLSQITLIYKYWIFIQNNPKFYTLKQ